MAAKQEQHHGRQFTGRGRITKLTEAERHAMPSSDFALREKRAYPIHDHEHAQLAIEEAKRHATPAQRRTISRAIEQKYPSLAGMAGELTQPEPK